MRQTLTFKHIAIMLLTVLCAGSVQAEIPVETAPEPLMSPTAQSPVDQLFSQLKLAQNEHVARRIAREIRNEWKNDGGATADLLIDWAEKAAKRTEYNVAIDLLDEVVTLYPDYLEGWNRRAVIYLRMNDTNRAIVDLSQVLAKEPRHFGALALLAGIFQARGLSEQAANIYRDLLAIYPMQRPAQRELRDLLESQADERI